MKIATTFALCALAALMGPACGGGAPATEGSSASALTTCSGTRPPSDECKTSFCDSGTWDYDFAPAGTTCKTTGTCDGDGNCLGGAKPPPAVTTTHFTAGDWYSLSLAWSGVSGASGYKVFSQNGLATQITTSLSATFSGLTPGTQYCFHVDAYNSAGTTTGTSVCAKTKYAENIAMLSWGTAATGGPSGPPPFAGRTSEFITPAYIDSLELKAQNVTTPGFLGIKLLSVQGQYHDCYDDSGLQYAWLPVGGSIGFWELINVYGTWPIPTNEYGGYAFDFKGCGVYQGQPLTYAPWDGFYMTVRYTQ